MRVLQIKLCQVLLNVLKWLDESRLSVQGIVKFSHPKVTHLEKLKIGFCLSVAILQQRLAKQPSCSDGLWAFQFASGVHVCNRLSPWAEGNWYEARTEAVCVGIWMTSSLGETVSQTPYEGPSLSQSSLTKKPFPFTQRQHGSPGSCLLMLSIFQLLLYLLFKTPCPSSEWVKYTQNTVFRYSASRN